MGKNMISGQHQYTPVLDGVFFFKGRLLTSLDGYMSDF